MRYRDTEYELCPHCKREILYTDIEQECRVCNRCADRMYAREQERREFEYYHPKDD